MKTPLISLMLISTGLTVIAQESKSHYKIESRISLPGDEGWDALTTDDEANLLYVSHSKQVQVVDLKTGKLTGSILNTNGVHGIAIAHDLNKGFISAGKDTAVTIFDLKTLATLAKIKVTGINPDAITYDKVTHKVFTFNGKSNNATVIDAKTNAILGTIALDGKPEFSVVDGMGNIFVNIEDKSELAEIDAKTMKVINEWSIAPGDEPSGLAIDIKNRKLFAVCSNKLMVVVNANTGKIDTTLAIGEHPDGAAFDAEKKRVYSSNGDGTLTVIQEEKNGKFSVLENVNTQKGARTIAVNIKTHHIYLPAAEYLPPAPSDKLKSRPAIKPGTFVILDIVPLD